MTFAAVVAAAAATTGPATAADAQPTDEQIRQEYRARRQNLLQATADGCRSGDLSHGTAVTVAACFHLHANLGWANARLARIDTAPPSGDMFWMYPIVTAMEAGRTDMSEANRARLRELWRTYFPYRGDTENHWLLYYSTLCLACELQPGAGPEAWYNHKSSAENIAEARSYIRDWMRITTSYGQGEFNSPNYIEEYAAPLALLAAYESDPQFRREARLMLDWIFYDYAVEQLNGDYGGAHSRIYPRQVVQPGQTPAAAFGWLLFGLGARQPRDTALIVAMSGYEPPPILWRIAHARAQPYVDRQLKRTRWRMREAGPGAFAIEGKMTAPVYKYTYMDPDFVLGCSQGGPLNSMQQETWSLIWRTDGPATAENTFFGLQPYSSPMLGTMYYDKRWDTAVHFMGTGATGKLDFDLPDKLEGGSPYEHVFQHGAALIALYEIAPGTRFSLIDTFFSRDLARREIDPSGWIFCQGGAAYIGYRPLAPGDWKPAGWTGRMSALAKDGQWFAAGFPDYIRGDASFVSYALNNGYVIQVAPARSFGSFEAFKEAMLDRPLKFVLQPVPEVKYTALDGSLLQFRVGDAPRVNGTPVDTEHWPLFDSPFGHADRGSGRLDLACEGEHLTIDLGAALRQEEGH